MGRIWRVVILASFVAALVAALVAVFLLVSTGERALPLQYALQSALMRYAAVTTMVIEPAGEIPMFLNPRDRIVTPRIMAGLFEPLETQYVVKSLRKGDTFVDVGANVGYYTLLAAKLVGDEGRVFAFEPDPESFALLERNVRLNGFTNVVLEQKAASNEEGTIRLYLAQENKGDHRIYQVPGEDRPFVDVEVVILDRYFADDRGQIDFVKIDTQGAELAILKGMTEILESNRDILLAVEFWPYGLRAFGDDAREMLDFLTERDFRLFDIRTGEVGPEWLLRNYWMEEHVFTNLLLVKGREEVARLRYEVQRWKREVERDGSEEARDEFERALQALRARQPRALTSPVAP